MSSNPKALAMARNRMKSRRETGSHITNTGSFGMPSKDIDEYGVNVGKLKQWANDRTKKLIEQEETQQEVAIARMRAFVIQLKHIVKMQSWYRGLVQRWKFKAYKFEKDTFRFRYLQAWYQYYKCEKLFRRKLCYGPFTEWAVETKDSIRLAQVAREIFKKAVEKLKLTPQAVMAFFNQRETQSGNISITEMNKVRRLILRKLYTAWQKENQRLQISRFRAGQVLARVARRIQERMAPKEFQMVSFHLWHRYASVKASFRRDEKEKAFVTPYIARWPRLLRILNSKRIKNKIADEKVQKVVFFRVMKAWRLAMEKEHSDIDDETAQDRAERHFDERLSRVVLLAWCALAKERGKNLRRREKYFRAWAKWAPYHREMRAKEAICKSWLVMRKLNDHLKAWIDRTDKAMHMRLARLRELRRRFFDINVLTVAYILLGRYGNFFLLDTWKRWKIWTQRRRAWKTVMWRFRLAWYDCKKKAIFLGWKYLTAIGSKKRKGVTKKEFVEQKVLTEGDSFLLSFDNMVHTADYLDDLRRNTALKRSGSGLYTPSYNRGPSTHLQTQASIPEQIDENSENEYEDEQPEVPQTVESHSPAIKPSEMASRHVHEGSMSPLDNNSISESKDSFQDSVTVDDDSLSELPMQFSKEFSFSRTESQPLVQEQKDNSAVTPTVRLARSLTIIEDLRDSTALKPMKATAEAGLALFSLASSGKMKIEQQRPTPNEFMTCCRAQALHQGGDLIMPGPLVQKGKLQEMLETLSVSTIGTLERFTNEHLEAERQTLAGALVMTPQEELDEALMPPDINKVISALLRGARVRSHHVEMISRRAEDEYLPLLTVLLSECIAYPCCRVFRGDIAEQVLHCSNPLASLTIGVHISRWSKAQITRREQDGLTEDRALTKYVGCGFQTVVFIRMAVLLVLRNRSTELEKISQKPAANVKLTEDEEVALVLRRRKISRLWEIEESLTKVIGLDIPPEFSKKEKIDQFREFNVLTEVEQEVNTRELFVPTTDHIDIKALLGEETLLLGELSEDAVSIRSVFIQRDDGFLSRGFMKQARKDYLNLRQSYFDNVHNTIVERRDALGIVRPLLGNKEEEEDDRPASKSGPKNSKKISKKKAAGGTLTSPPGTGVSDALTMTIDTDFDETLTQELPTDADQERPQTAMTDGTVPSPGEPKDGALETKQVPISPTKPDNESDSDELSDVDDVEAVPNTSELSLDERRKELLSRGGTLIGGSWGIGTEENALQSTRLNMFPSLIVEAWRPRPKGRLLNPLDAPSDDKKKKKKKEKTISIQKQQEEEKKAEKMAKHIMNMDIAMILVTRFVEESASAINRFVDILNKAGIEFPKRLNFPQSIIENMTKPYQIMHKKGGKKPGTAGSRKSAPATPMTDRLVSTVAALKPDHPTEDGRTTALVSVLGPDGFLVSEGNQVATEPDITTTSDDPLGENAVTPMVSEFLVEAIYHKPQLNYLTNLKQWWWLPRHWWAPSRLHCIIEEEVHEVEGEIKQRKNEASKILHERKDLTSQISELRDFLQGARNAVLSVGAKSMSEAKVLTRQKNAKIRLLNETKNMITVKKAKLVEQNALCVAVRNLIDLNEVDQALIHMGVESGFSAPGEVEMEKMKFHAVELLTKQEIVLKELGEKVEELTENVKRQEKDIIKFDRQTVTLKDMLKNLALDRFDTVVNVQKHLELQTEQLSAFKKREIEETKRLKKLSDSLHKLHELSLYYGQYLQDEAFTEKFKPIAGGKGIRKKMVVNDIGDWEEVLIDDDDSVGKAAEYESLSRPREGAMLDFGKLIRKTILPTKKPIMAQSSDSMDDLRTFEPVDVSDHVPAPLDGSQAWPEWMSEMNKPAKKKNLKRGESIDPISGKPVIFHTGFSNVDDFKNYLSGESDDEADEKDLVVHLMERKEQSKEASAANSSSNDDAAAGTTEKKGNSLSITTFLGTSLPPVSHSELNTDGGRDDISEVTGFTGVVTPSDQSRRNSVTPQRRKSSTAERRKSIQIFSRSVSGDLRNMIKGTVLDEEVEEVDEAEEEARKESELLGLFKADTVQEGTDENETDTDDDEVYSLEESSRNRMDEVGIDRASQLNKKIKPTQLSAQRLVQLEMEEEKRLKEDQKQLADVPIEIVRGEINAEYWRVLNQIAMMNANDEPSVVTEESSLSTAGKIELDTVLPHEFADAMERKKRIKRAIKARQKSRTGRMYNAVARSKRIKAYRARMTTVNKSMQEEDVFDELADLFGDSDDETDNKSLEELLDELSLDDNIVAQAWAPEAHSQLAVVGEKGSFDTLTQGDAIPASVSMLTSLTGSMISPDGVETKNRRKAVAAISGRDPFVFPATQWVDKYKANMKSPVKEHIVRTTVNNEFTHVDSGYRANEFTSEIGDGFESGMLSRPTSPPSPQLLGKPGIKIGNSSRVIVPGDDDANSVHSDSDSSVHMVGGHDETTRRLLEEFAKAGSFGIDIVRKSESRSSSEEENEVAPPQIEHSHPTSSNIVVEIPKPEESTMGLVSSVKNEEIDPSVSNASKPSDPPVKTIPKPSVKVQEFHKDLEIPVSHKAGVVSTPIVVAANVAATDTPEPKLDDPGSAPAPISKLSASVITTGEASDTKPEPFAPAPAPEIIESFAPVMDLAGPNSNLGALRSQLNSQGRIMSARRSVRFNDANEAPDIEALAAPAVANVSDAKPEVSTQRSRGILLTTPDKMTSDGNRVKYDRAGSMDDSITSDSSLQGGLPPNASVEKHFSNSYNDVGDDMSFFDLYNQMAPLRTPNILNISKPSSPIPDALVKEKKKVEKEYKNEIRKTPEKRFKKPSVVLVEAAAPKISNAAAKVIAKREANVAGEQMPSQVFVQSYEQSSPSTRARMPTGTIRPPLYSHLDPGEFTPHTSTCDSNLSMYAIPDDNGRANSEKLEKAVQKAIDASANGSFIAVSGSGLFPSSTDVRQKKPKTGKVSKAAGTRKKLTESAGTDIDETPDMELLLGGEDLMAKLTKQSASSPSEESRKHITVADVVKGSEAYYSLADFVKFNLDDRSAKKEPSRKKGHNSIIQVGFKKEAHPTISTIDEGSESGSMFSGSMRSLGSKNVAPVPQANQFIDSDVESDDEDAHARWSQLNMSDEHLTAIANSLKDAVLYDSQVPDEKAYVKALSSPPSERNTMTPLLNDRGQLALALRKTFQKFSGADEGESKVRNKKYWILRQERERVKRNYDETKSKLARATARKILSENSTMGNVLNEGDADSTSVISRRQTPVEIRGRAQGESDIKPTVGGELLPQKPRKPLVIEEDSTAREGYYVPALHVYTDDMRIDMERIKRQPYFNDAGELVIPPLQIDDTLSAGLSGVPLQDSKKGMNESHPLREQQTPGINMRTMKLSEPIKPHFASDSNIIKFFRGDGGDGTIPLPFDLDDDFHINNNSSNPMDKEDDRRAKLLKKHLSSMTPQPDVQTTRSGDSINMKPYDFFAIDDGDDEVQKAYRTLLDLKSQNENRLDEMPENRLIADDVGNTYRLFERGVAEDGSESSQSLPYPYPFPSTMYDSKPPSRPNLTPVEADSLGLEGRPVPLYIPQKSKKSKNRIRDMVHEQSGISVQPSAILSKIPSANQPAPESPPPPFWIQHHDTSNNDRNVKDDGSRHTKSADDQSAASSLLSQKDLIAPAAITRAVVSVGSSRNGRARSANREELTKYSEAEDVDHFPLGPAPPLEAFNNSSISSCPEEVDSEAIMEAELRRMLRGESTGASGLGVDRPVSGGLRAIEDDNISLPKISAPLKGYYSTTALSLVNTTSSAAMNSLNRATLSKRPVNKQAGITKLNTFARSLSETNTAMTSGHPTFSEESPLITGNKLSASLINAGNSSFGKLKSKSHGIPKL